jgi:hypothetical protein
VAEGGAAARGIPWCRATRWIDAVPAHLLRFSSSSRLGEGDLSPMLSLVSGPGAYGL